MDSGSASPDLLVVSHGPEGRVQSRLAPLLNKAITGALTGELRISTELRELNGMSGLRYRQMANDLFASLPDARYLEIGAFRGSTLCSAIAGNKVRALVIDNWSEFGGPAAEFYRNLARFKGPAARVSVLEEDYRAVDYRQVGRFNVYMFDGPHTEQDHYNAVIVAQPALDDEFILIIDDWNLPHVRRGTRRALTELRLIVEGWTEIRTTLDDTHPPGGWHLSDWHDGYLLAVLRKSLSDALP